MSQLAPMQARAITQASPKEVNVHVVLLAMEWNNDGTDASKYIHDLTSLGNSVEAWLFAAFKIWPCS